MLEEHYYSEHPRQVDIEDFLRKLDKTDTKKRRKRQRQTPQTY
jgi:hypothetical protein